MLSRLNSSTFWRMCRTGLASLSKAQTRTTSKRPRRASRIIRSSPGRRAFAPLMVSV
jgi:hypothetical protein